MEEIRTGIIYGRNHRAFISIPTRYGKNKPIWVHYLINTTSPYSFLTVDAVDALVDPDFAFFKEEINVEINGEKILMETSTDHFYSVNTVGMNFMMKRK